MQVKVTRRFLMLGKWREPGDIVEIQDERLSYFTDQNLVQTLTPSTSQSTPNVPASEESNSKSEATVSKPKARKGRKNK